MSKKPHTVHHIGERSSIVSKPASEAYRDNWERIFGSRNREFCPHCGAGIGQHFREGEGTCEKCDPPDENGNTRGFQGGK